MTAPCAAARKVRFCGSLRRRACSCCIRNCWWRATAEALAQARGKCRRPESPPELVCLQCTVPGEQQQPDEADHTMPGELA